MNRRRHYMAAYYAALVAALAQGHSYEAAIGIAEVVAGGAA